MLLKQPGLLELLIIKIEHWKELPLNFIEKLGQDFYILKTNIDHVDKCPAVKAIPLFYQEAIIAFTKAKAIKVVLSAWGLSRGNNCPMTLHNNNNLICYKLRHKKHI